ncbi:hypothetical protein N7465_002039 [Penicillium sp. CMV-2018d]|nr:hypothetical protein N7465_002039 [Penicillium sp. CMV-2018d]
MINFQVVYMGKGSHVQALGIPQLVVQQSEGDLEINRVLWVMKVVRGPFLASWNIEQSQLVSRLIIRLLYLRKVFPAHLLFEPFDICASRQISGLAGINKAGWSRGPSPHWSLLCLSRITVLIVRLWNLNSEHFDVKQRVYL